MSKHPKDDLPILSFRDRGAWEVWLASNHSSARGVWIKLAKKGSGVPSVSREELLEVGLCYGWIDGQGSSLDESYWLQRYTPRTARSKWSQKNRTAAILLIESGAMHPAGLAAVEAAQADGRWDAAYASPSRITVPDDLREALERNEPARKAFEALDARNRYAILFRIQDAKRSETRARRINKFVDMLAAGGKIY